MICLRISTAYCARDASWCGSGRRGSSRMRRGHLTVLYEDDDVIAVNKPAGLPTLPGANFLQSTLLYLVRAPAPDAAPLHRLGRWTSGIVLCARKSECPDRIDASMVGKTGRQTLPRACKRAARLGPNGRSPRLSARCRTPCSDRSMPRLRRKVRLVLRDRHRTPRRFLPLRCTY